jgi:hypothetical protein
MSSELETELADLRRRLAKARGMLEQQAIIVTDSREVLARESTWPRPRAIVEAELERATRFDVPTLLEVIVQSERKIVELEAAIREAASAEKAASQGAAESHES